MDRLGDGLPVGGPRQQGEGVQHHVHGSLGKGLEQVAAHVVATLEGVAVVHDHQGLGRPALLPVDLSDPDDDLLGHEPVSLGYLILPVRGVGLRRHLGPVEGQIDEVHLHLLLRGTSLVDAVDVPEEVEEVRGVPERVHAQVSEDRQEPPADLLSFEVRRGHDLFQVALEISSAELREYRSHSFAEPRIRHQFGDELVLCRLGVPPLGEDHQIVLLEQAEEVADRVQRRLFGQELDVRSQGLRDGGGSGRGPGPSTSETSTRSYSGEARAA